VFQNSCCSRCPYTQEQHHTTAAAATSQKKGRSEQYEYTQENFERNFIFFLVNINQSAKKKEKEKEDSVVQ